MSSFTELNPNPLVQYLNKPAEEFTKADLVKYVEDHNIEMINFRYTGGDGRLKALNFVINSRDHLNSILTTGERIDGSSLFPFIVNRFQRPLCCSPLPHSFCKILFQKSLHWTFFVHTTTKMENHWKVRRSTFCAKHIKH